MTFTNTNDLGNNWYWYEVWGHVTWQVNDQAVEQVKWEVDAQIHPIKNKIKEEINK